MGTVGKNDVAVLCFGSVDAARKRIAERLKAARIAQGVQPREFNERCAFAAQGLPLCNEYETNPDLVDRWVFSAASMELGVDAGSLIGCEMDEERRHKIFSMMKRDDVLLAATGEEGSAEVTYEQLAPLYVVVKTLSAIG